MENLKNIYANEVKVGHVVYVYGSERLGVVVDIQTRQLVTGVHYDFTFDNGETSTHRQDRIVNVEVDRKFNQHDVRQARQLLELTQGDVDAAKRMALGGHADEARKCLAAAVEAVAPKDAPDDAPKTHRENYA